MSNDRRPFKPGAYYVVTDDSHELTVNARVGDIVRYARESVSDGYRIMAFPGESTGLRPLIRVHSSGIKLLDPAVVRVLYGDTDA